MFDVGYGHVGRKLPSVARHMAPMRRSEVNADTKERLEPLNHNKYKFDFSKKLNMIRFSNFGVICLIDPSK